MAYLKLYLMARPGNRQLRYRRFYLLPPLSFYEAETSEIRQRPKCFQISCRVLRTLQGSRVAVLRTLLGGTVHYKASYLALPLILFLIFLILFTLAYGVNDREAKS
jgi:hypothetical protein